MGRRHVRGWGGGRGRLGRRHEGGWGRVEGVQEKGQGDGQKCHLNLFFGITIHMSVEGEMVFCECAI